MRYFTEMLACRDKLNLFTIWDMVAYANEINAMYPLNWFLDRQVKSLQGFSERAGKYLKVPAVCVDPYTVEFVLKGLGWEVEACLADSDVTTYSVEYSEATRFLRDKLAERFKC